MNKQTTIRAVAGKTGMTYFEVQIVLEAMMEVWGEALVHGDQITIQDFLTIKVIEMKTHQRGALRHHNPNTTMRNVAYRVNVRLSQRLKDVLYAKRK